VTLSEHEAAALRVQLEAQRQVTEAARATQEIPAFDRFFLAEFRAIVRTVMLAGAPYETARDAVQEAMVLAMARFDQLEKPAAWVRRVAVRIYNRQSIREQWDTGEPEAPRHRGVPLPRSAAPAAPELMQGALQGLSPAQRMVIALELDGYTPTDIAASLDKLPDTVRGTVVQARSALTEALKQSA
jgi:RNA polymerase sigma-70 factor (ECF subfamily)